MSKSSSSRSRKKRKLRRWKGYLLFLFLGAFLTVIAFSVLKREAPPTQQEFSRKILLVDQIIQGQLYKAGIPKKNILEDQTVSKKDKSFTWEESDLKIQILPSHSFFQIEESFRQNLSSLGKDISIQTFEEPEIFRLEVRVLGRVTHVLCFIPAPTPPIKISRRPKMAIVIDDIGGENKISQELLRWDVPITFSVFPYTPYSKKFAGEAHQKGRDVLLHLPMEPHGYPEVRPGEGVLLKDMDTASLLQQLSKDIEAVPYIKGVNNHMGSLFTEDAEKMKIVLSELKRRGLFFLDSRTTSGTTGLQVANAIGLKAKERKVFIDYALDEETIKKQINQLIQLSLANGEVIGIGHPYPATVKVLKEMLPKIKQKGITIVPLSSLMK